MASTPYYSEEFNNYNADSMSLIMNSGSFSFYWSTIPTAVVSSAAVNQVAVCLRQYETMRKIGAKVMINNKLEFMMKANQKLFLEVYTDMWIMVYFQLIEWTNPFGIMDQLWEE